MPLDTLFQNETEPKFLKVILNTDLKGWRLIKYKENFFIWESKKHRGHYKRLTLIRTGWHENTLFYWNYEPDFKPHSKKENINIKSETFKADEDKKFYSYFLDMIEHIQKES